MDELFGKLDTLGAVVALTADHGMNDKSNADETPKVIWLQDILDQAFGENSALVICPITDYFVAHHGWFGSFVRVYCIGKATPADVIRVPASCLASRWCATRKPPRACSICRWIVRAMSW